MLLLFVHGWSVTSTETYGELPEALARHAPAELNLEVRHVYLGRYISFHDEVTMDDIACAFDFAIREQIPGNKDAKKPFSCVTHSTGGPVIRTWVDKYYGAAKLGQCPLRHLVMLAPANHGSALAQLGKSRLGRIKAWFHGVEPGKKVLDWLALGSGQQVELNRAYLAYQPPEKRFFPYVITGQTIDSKLYDHLNSYTGEVGSDGVVWVAAANMNFRYVRLKQSEEVLSKRPLIQRLQVDAGPKGPPPTPLAVIPRTSHSGGKMGIMRSVEADDPPKPAVQLILAALKVNTPAQFETARRQFEQVTENTQRNVASPDKMDRYAMLIWRLFDDTGLAITDYDLLLLASARYHPDLLPKGFFVDRQGNAMDRNTLAYYVNYDRMKTVADGKIGFRVVARPNEGFSYYLAGEFRSENLPLDTLLCPNETLIVDIILKRRVDQEVFRLDGVDRRGRLPRVNFKRVRPSGETTPPA